mmetsp:Transcript_46106/g.147257  ORF Transcript_46106/g.147257 Transcript_46106/m.147257 type:complete len:284 (-) Transcript_46106:7-858(-)
MRARYQQPSPAQHAQTSLPMGSFLGEDAFSAAALHLLGEHASTADNASSTTLHRHEAAKASASWPSLRVATTTRKIRCTSSLEAASCEARCFWRHFSAATSVLANKLSNSASKDGGAAEDRNSKRAKASPTVRCGLVSVSQSACVPATEATAWRKTSWHCVHATNASSATSGARVQRKARSAGGTAWPPVLSVARKRSSQVCRVSSNTETTSVASPSSFASDRPVQSKYASASKRRASSSADGSVAVASSRCSPRLVDWPHCFSKETMANRRLALATLGPAWR